MPRAKRNKVVALTKVVKKTRSDNSNHIDRLRLAADEHPYVWVFSVGNMRNNFLKQVREAWKGSVIFYGKNALARKALGETEETECRKGIRGVAQHLNGPVGLLFTSSPPSEVTTWFADYSAATYARSGAVATRDVVLPAGPVMLATLDQGGTAPEPEQLPHSVEPQLRKLGMPTELKRGVPTLLKEHVVARKGKKLTTDNAHILKHILLPLSTFRIVPLAYWSAIDAESNAPSTETGIPGFRLLELSAEDRALVDEGMSAASVGNKGVKSKQRRTKAEQQAVMDAEGEGEQAGDVEMDDDEEGSDAETEDGDRVTGDMMLPAGIV